jgi:hypothetical protein
VVGEAGAAYNIGSDKDVDLDGSRHQFNDDRERKPEIGKGKPGEDEIEEVILYHQL